MRLQCIMLPSQGTSVHAGTREGLKPILLTKVKGPWEEVVVAAVGEQVIEVEGEVESVEKRPQTLLCSRRLMGSSRWAEG